LSSIEQRWHKTDQDIFVAGMFLNPFHKAWPFRAAHFSTMAGLFNLLFHLWRQFYYTGPPAEFYMEFTDYISSSRNFVCMDNFMCGMMAMATKEGKKVNLLDIWAAVTHPNNPPTPLVQLARHILSICPNSALVECLWSVFGTILTRLHTHLGNKALITLAELKLYL
ncbi:hypothetical protein K439DRAFT_1374791, partial [Ramaria rubella]